MFGIIDWPFRRCQQPDWWTQTLQRMSQTHSPQHALSSWASPILGCVFAAVCLLSAAVAQAAMVVTLDASDPSALAEQRAAMEETLRTLGEEVLPQPDAVAAWSARIVDAPPAEPDAAFMRQAAANEIGRNLFFESDFEGAADTLQPGVDMLLATPEVLAFHPDLAPAAFQAALTLVRVYDTLGDAEAAAATMSATAQLWWAAEPPAAEFPPAFIEDYAAVRSLMPTRAIDVTWRGGDACGVWLNGIRTEIAESGESLRVPAGGHFLRVVCRDARSFVHRIADHRTAVHVDLTFDDAARFDENGLVLRPRRRDTASLQRLAAVAADVFEEPVVYVLAEAQSATEDRAQVVELSRVEPDGAIPVRATRVVLEGPTNDARMAAAVAYLVSGRTTSDLRVWNEATGWALPDVARTRSPSAWVLGGAALALAGGAVVSELRVRESLRDLDTCRDRVGCGENVPGLRSDARRARATANVLWSVAGAATVGAITWRVATRGGEDDVLGVAPVEGGAMGWWSTRF